MHYAQFNLYVAEKAYSARNNLFVEHVSTSYVNYVLSSIATSYRAGRTGCLLSLSAKMKYEDMLVSYSMNGL